MLYTKEDARSAARSVLRYVDGPRRSHDVVLIDVLDIGDAWRVYFGRTRAGVGPVADLAVSPTLLQLDKATARVRLEEPLTDLAAPSAQDSLKAMLRDEVGPRLRELGFTGSGRVFRLPSVSYYATWGLQGSMYSNAAVARLYLNVSVVPKTVWDAAVAAHGGPRRPGATAVGPKPGWYTRAEAINPAQIPERWYILQGFPTTPTADRLLHVTEHDIVPAMQRAMQSLPA